MDKQQNSLERLKFKNLVEIGWQFSNERSDTLFLILRVAQYQRKIRQKQGHLSQCNL